MKKTTMLSILLFGISCMTGMAQIEISENFDSGVPDDWNTTTFFENTSNVACEGSSERMNFYYYDETTTTGYVATPNFVGISNETDLSFSFDYKIVDYSWFSDPTNPTSAGWGTAEFQYSLDDGETWTTALTINDDNHVVSNSCATMNGVIPAASLPSGSDIKLRIYITWAAGDYYFYVDNFSANQVGSNPPNCDANLTSPMAGETDANILNGLTWSEATGMPTGYILTMGTAAGGNDILDNVDVGNVLTYEVAMSAGTTYFVTITPYNSNGSALDCVEESFTTTVLPECPVDTTVMDDCGNFDFDITWSEVDSADGYYISVGSTSGGVDISDAEDVGNSLSYTISEPTADTAYYVTVTAYNSVGESADCAEVMLTTSETECYCVPAFSSGCTGGDQINGFEIPDADFSHLDTGCSDGAYGDYSDMIITLYVNSTYDYIIGHAYGGQNVRIWIDFNEDYEFDNSEGSLELVAIDGSTGTNSNAVTNGTLTIPESVSPGVYRMRVGDRWNSQPIPCNSIGFGEAHDYTVEILELTCAPAEVAAAAVPDCDSDQFYVDVVVTEFGDLVDLTDGTQTQTVSEGQPLYNFGPYPSGSEVTISTNHSDEACDFEVGSYVYFCPPSNDECDAPIVLTANTDLECSVVTSATTLGATESTQEDDITGTPNTDVWFSFEAISSVHQIEISNVVNLGGGTSTSTDMGMAVYDAANGCEALTLVDDSDPNILLLEDLTVGNTYLVRVYGWYSSVQYNSFDICLGSVMCTAAELVATTVPDCDSGQFYIDVVVTSFGDLESLSDGTQTQTTSEGQPLYNFGPYASGEEVTISAVHTDATCDFEVGTYNFICPPENDACSSAFLVSSLPYSFSQDAVGATNNDGFVGSCGSGMNDGVWYTFMVDESGTIEVDISEVTGWDLELAVYSGTCGDFTCVTSSDSGYSGDGESVSFTGDAGVQYYVNIGHYSGTGDNSEGPFTIDVSSPDTATLSPTLSIIDHLEESSFTYFPNPVNDKLSIRSQNNIELITVMNMLGQEVMKMSPNSISSDVEMSQLQTGAYFVKVSIGDSSEIIRIIKE